MKTQLLILTFLFSMNLQAEITIAQKEKTFDDLANWAENHVEFKKMFEPHQESQTFSSQGFQTSPKLPYEWRFRLYPKTSNIVGIYLLKDIYVTGPSFGLAFPETFKVGDVSDIGRNSLIDQDPLTTYCSFVGIRPSATKQKP